MKTFQEVYDQVLAEMLAGRHKASPKQKHQSFERPPYILKTTVRSVPGNKPDDPSPFTPKGKTSTLAKPRDLTAGQIEALKCFRRHGEHLDENAGITEIKRAFRRLAKKLHPDTVSDLTPEAQKRQAQEFRQILLAYRILLERPIPYK